MACSPDPRTLLLPDPDAIPSFLGNKFAAMVGGSIGFLTIVLSRYLARRPVYSGIQHHIMWAGSGAGLSHLAYLRYVRYNSDRDAMYRHYIELHPEDFPLPERKRVGEVFQTFHPIR